MRGSEDQGPGKAPGGAFDMTALLAEAAWVQELARRLTGDPDRAGDIAQGTMALALEKRPATRDGLRPWLGSVVSRLARRQVRGSTRRHHHERQAAALGSGRSPGADDLVLRVEAQRHLADATCRLPEPYRDVLLRRFYDGQGIEEIALARGQTASTVRSQISRGMARLREEFEGEGPTRIGKRHSLDGLGLLALAAGRGDGLSFGSAAATAGIVGAPTGSAGPGAATWPILLKVVGPVALMLSALLAARYHSSGGELADVDLASLPSRPDGPGHRSAERMPPPASGPRDVVPSTAVGGLAEVAASTADSAASAASGAYAAIRVRVISNDLRPVEGARLRWNEPVAVAGFDAKVAVTDADGVAVLELAGTSLARYQIQGVHAPFLCEAPGYRRTYLEAFVEHAGVTDLGRVSLQAGCSVSGRVVWENGEPAAGARVLSGGRLGPDVGELRRIDGPYPNERRVRTHATANGAFVCDGLRPGQVRLWAQADGALWTLSNPVKVVAGGSVNVGDMVLTPALDSEMITGRVLGSRGSGATIWVESSVGRVRHSVRADSDGLFRFLPPQGRPVAIAVEALGEPRWMGPLIIARAGDTLEVKLAPAHSVEVVIVDAGGAPVSGALIQPYLEGTSYLAPLGGGPQPMPGAAGARANTQGRATLSLPVVPFSLRCEAGPVGSGLGGPFAADHAGPILIRLKAPVSGGPGEGGDVEVGSTGPEDGDQGEGPEAPLGSAQITGAFHIDGKPQAGWAVSVRLRYSDPAVDSGLPGIWTDSTGRFRCEVAPGRYDITLTGTLGSGEQVTVLRETHVQGPKFPWECNLVTASVSLNLEESLLHGRVVRGDPRNGWREITDLGPVSAGPIRVTLPVGAGVLQKLERAGTWEFVQGVLSKATVRRSVGRGH